LTARPSNLSPPTPLPYSEQRRYRSPFDGTSLTKLHTTNRPSEGGPIAVGTAICTSPASTSQPHAATPRHHHGARRDSPLIGSASTSEVFLDCAAPHSSMLLVRPARHHTALASSVCAPHRIRAAPVRQFGPRHNRSTPCTTALQPLTCRPFSAPLREIHIARALDPSK
jgi:hypothetical protein